MSTSKEVSALTVLQTSLSLSPFARQRLDSSGYDSADPVRREAEVSRGTLPDDTNSIDAMDRALMENVQVTLSFSSSLSSLSHGK